MSITDYRDDGRFPPNRRAFLVTGKRENDQINRRLLALNQTGHWIAAKGRIEIGDTIFILLPNPNHPSGYPRELYAGVITHQSRREPDNRLLLTVERFHHLPPINDAVKVFLNGRLPPQGSMVQTVWE